MADNVVLNSGTGGASVAADDIAGIHHQRVKVQHGADGSATDASAASPLPVDDADTQTALATLNAAVDTLESLLGSIKTAVEISDNAIAGSEMQVDVVAALPAGTNNIGDVDVLTVPADPFGANADAAVAAGAAGSVQAKLRRATTQLDAIQTAVETLDNTVAGAEMQVDVVTRPAGAATTDTITAKLATDAIHSGTTALTPKFAIIDAATSGDNTLLAAVASKKIRVLSVYLVAAGAVIARFESGAGGTALSGQMNLAANGGFVLPFSPVGHFETASNVLLNLELSAAVSVDGGFVYIEV